MEYKKINWSFLCFLILEMLLMVYLLFWGSWIDLDNVFLSTALAESTIVLPPVVVLILNRKKYNLFDRLMIKKIRPVTIVAVCLYAILIMPLGTLANAISLLWVDNTVLESSDMMLNAPWFITFFTSAIMAPCIEELVFRGFMFAGYRKDGARISAVIMSALAFAFMHLNFNQAAYAFILGAVFALIVEATGSLWASIICHFFFNAESVVFMLIGNYIDPSMYEDTSINRAEVIDNMPAYIIAAGIATLLAVCVLAWAAKLENRTDTMRKLFGADDDGKTKVKIISAPIVIAFVLCLTYMILTI